MRLQTIFNNLNEVKKEKAEEEEVDLDKKPAYKLKSVRRESNPPNDEALSC